MEKIDSIVEILNLPSGSATNIVLLYVGAGVMFVIFTIVLLVIIFAVATKKSLDSYKGTAAFVFLLLALSASVFTVGRNTLYQAKADAVIDTNKVQVVSMDNTYFLVTFETEEAEIAYLVIETEDGTTVPVLPTYTLEKRNSHSLLVPKTAREQDVYVVVRGRKHLINL